MYNDLYIRFNPRSRGPKIIGFGSQGRFRGRVYWAVLDTGETIFHDLGRDRGVIIPELWNYRLGFAPSGGPLLYVHKDGPLPAGAKGWAAVRWGYLRGKAYEYPTDNDMRALVDQLPDYVEKHSRRNPYYDVEEDEDDFILFEDDY